MMFPNISYNTKSNVTEPSLASNIHISNYQNSLSYINQQLQLNNSIFASSIPAASTTLQLLQQHKSSTASSKKQQSQHRDVTSFSSSSSSTSSCSSSSSSTANTNQNSFLPCLANLRKEIGGHQQPQHGLLPPIFNQNNQQSSFQNHSFLDSFKSLNPATLSMANDYLNNYLLSFTSTTQQSQFLQQQHNQTLITKPLIHVDKVI